MESMVRSVFGLYGNHELNLMLRTRHKGSNNGIRSYLDANANGHSFTEKGGAKVFLLRWLVKAHE